MDSNWLVDQMDTALDHAEKVWPHNGIAIEDALIDLAVQLAIENVELWPTDKGFPGVRIIYPVTNGLGYYAEQVQGPEWLRAKFMHRTYTGWCGRCAHKHQTYRVLYVPAGMSIVAVELCASCTKYMATSFSPLKWLDVGA